MDACKQPRPCKDTEWSWTGEERCNGERVERNYVSNCGTTEWRDDRAVVWTSTGVYDCVGTTRMLKQTNTCGTVRWVAAGTVTWTDTGVRQCTTTMWQKEQKDQCGNTKWVDIEPVVWTDTGDTRCENHVVQYKQTNQCGQVKWRVTTVVCGYEASIELPCGGYAYAPTDDRDPAANVPMTDLSGAVIGYLYPTPAAWHNVPVEINTVCDPCSSTVIGYAANKGEAAPANKCSECN